MAISQGIHGPVLGPLASLVMNGVLIGICMALLFHKKWRRDDGLPLFFNGNGGESWTSPTCSPAQYSACNCRLPHRWSKPRCSKIYRLPYWSPSSQMHSLELEFGLYFKQADGLLLPTSARNLS